MSALTTPQVPCGPHILVVEDDAITARYVHRCLCNVGLAPPQTAASAEEALRLATAARPDLVVMDITLRGAMDGIEAVSRLRAHAGTRVVVISAQGDEATRQRAMAAGACGFLAKPFLKQELYATIERVLGVSLSHIDGGVPSSVAAAPPKPVATPSPNPSLHASQPVPTPASSPTRSVYPTTVPTLERHEQVPAQLRAGAERGRNGPLLERAPEGQVVTSSAGIILEANHEASELLGMEAAQLVGTPLSLFVTHGSYEDYYRLLEKLERSRQRHQWNTLLRPRGRPAFHASVAVLAALGADGTRVLAWTLRDRNAPLAESAFPRRARAPSAGLARLNAALQKEITAWRRASASSWEGTHLPQTIADAAPSMLYAYSLSDQTITYLNAHAQAFLGYYGEMTRSARLANLLEVAHPDDHERVRHHGARLRQAADGEVIESTLRVRHVDGNWRWIRIRDVISARDASGAPVQCVGAAEDVTAQHAAQVALIRAERLADAGRLAASFAHEINNPLQGVLGCLSLMEEALAQGHDASRFLDVAQQEVRRAVRVVGQLRDLGRQARTTGERVDIDLRDTITRVLAVTEKRSAEQQVHVTWAPPESMPLIEADGDAIQQVFLNLVLNALDAMPDGGTLTIQATPTTAPEGMCIAITDSGPGIDADLLPRLFESFATTKPDGLGLGLYISRNIIEHHGGHITVETHTGSGTTFSVWLPSHPADQRSAEQ